MPNPCSFNTLLNFLQECNKSQKSKHEQMQYIEQK